MGFYRIRFDLYITLIVSILLGLGAAKLVDVLEEKNNQAWAGSGIVVSDTAIQTVMTGDPVGAKADDSLLRVHSIEDIRAQTGMFTMEVSRTNCNVISGAGGFWWVELEPGKVIAVLVLQESIHQQESQNGGLGQYVFPAGIRVDKAPSDEVLKWAEMNGHPLTVTDFYIDMKGENQTKMVINPYSFGGFLILPVTIIAFIVIHLIFVKLGLFPPLFPAKKSRNSPEIK